MEHFPLKHDLLTASIIAPHHAGTVVAVQVLPRGSSLRLGGIRRRWVGMLRVRRHGHAQTHAEPLVASGDVVQAACVLGGVVADGGVLVRALRPRQREPVGTQKVIQVLVAVARRQRSTPVTAVQGEREAPESRVPARVHSGGGVSVLYDVELWKLLNAGTTVVVWISWVH